MKYALALHGCLFVASLTSLAASGATLPAPEVTARAPWTDQVSVKYWGNYAGSQLAHPTSTHTTDPFGNIDRTMQNADDSLTAGYKISKDFQAGIGIPFNFLPKSDHEAIQVKPVYVGLLDAKIFEVGNVSMHSDFRVYTPYGDLARTWDEKWGLRASQTTLWKLPQYDTTLGVYTYERTYKYGNNGKGFRLDRELNLSPFADHRIAKNLYATVWTDVCQFSHEFGKGGGMTNLPMDVQPGIRWEVEKKLSLNPYLNLIPSRLRADNINMGMVVNAEFL